MAKLELRLKTWIPGNMVFFDTAGGFSTYFGGDNRSEAWEGTYRTSQRFVIDTSNYSVSPAKDTGITYKYMYDDYEGKLYSKQNKKASTAGLTYKKRIENGTLYLDCVCSVGNPFVSYAPKIDYKFTLKVTRLGSVRITGKHDGFPGYEFWRKFSGKKAELIWSHDPRDTGEGLGSLGGSMEHSVNKGKSA